MSDDRFDDLARAAAGGMSRRRLMKLFAAGAASAAVAKAGIKPSVAAAAGTQPAVAAQQTSSICAVLLNLLASLPFLGGLLNFLLGIFGCPTPSPGNQPCLPEGSRCSALSSQQCCGTCLNGRCAAAVRGCCQCYLPLGGFCDCYTTTALNCTGLRNSCGSLKSAGGTTCEDLAPVFMLGKTCTNRVCI